MGAGFLSLSDLSGRLKGYQMNNTDTCMFGGSFYFDTHPSLEVLDAQTPVSTRLDGPCHPNILPC